MGAFDRRLKVPDTVVFRELDGEAVLVNLQTGIFFGLDDIGTRVFRVIVQGGSPATAVEVLRAEFDAEEERLRADIEALIAQMRDKGLLVED